MNKARADDNENDNIIQDDKSLQCLRIEINSHVSLFLYYKPYPKPNSEKFPQKLTAIFFFFEREYINEKFFYTYFSLVGQIDTVEFGSYMNRKGSKNKRKIIHFAIVKFIDEDSLALLMDRSSTQKKINEFIEMTRNRNIQISFDPLKDIEDEDQSNEKPDEEEDGFVKVTRQKNKKRFTKGGMTFKVCKGNEEDNELKKSKKKKGENDFYWNFQLLDRKRQMYDELKNLFDEDKQAISIKKNKKMKLE